MNKVGSAEWAAEIEKNMLQPGNARTCAPPTEIQQLCFKCNRCFTQAKFSVSQWLHRHARQAVCEQCELHLGHQCNTLLSQAQFSSSQWLLRHNRQGSL
eukprot:405563-Karenia_brevis.AAC.1